MHPDVEKLVSAGRINQAVGEKLSTLSPDQYVLHGSWGAGKVQSWDLFSGKVTIDFEESKDQTMGLKLALQKLLPLQEDDVRVQRFSDLDSLKTLAKEDPAELVVRILKAYEGRMKPDMLDDELAGVVIAKEDYKKWWDKAKKALRESKRANVPSKRTEDITLRNENESPLQSLINDFEAAKTIKNKIKTLDAVKAETEALQDDLDAVGKIVSDIEVIARKSLKLNTGQTLELLCVREEIIELVEKYEAPEERFSIAEALQQIEADLAAEVSPLASVRQRRIYLSYPGAFEDQWIDKLLNLFDEVGTRGVSEIAKILDEKEELKAFNKHIKKALSRRSLGPDALSWLCRERNKASEKSFGFEVGQAVLNIIESDYLEDGPRKSNRLQAYVMEDRELITDFLKGIEKNDVKNFCKKLLSSPAFPDLDRKSLMARIIKKLPETQKLVAGTVTKKDKSLIVSWDSLERKRAEYEDLVKERIPQNIKDIAIARSYGDLRENFEYKAAKDMQLVLNRRKGEVESELNRAKGTDFADADTSAANVGTVVTLEDSKKKASVYTILGAWDGDPDKKTVSYQSEVAKGIIGKKVGEAVKVQDFDSDAIFDFKIKSIDKFFKG